MMGVMRTTVRLADELLSRAKMKAAAEGRTLTSLIEEGLRVVLTESQPPPGGRIELPVCSSGGGVLPGVDLNRNAVLEDLMNRP